MAPNRRLVLLIALAGTLAAARAALWLSEEAPGRTAVSPTPRASAGRPAAPDSAAGSPVRLIAGADWQVIAERPLFSEARRPYVPPPPPPAPRIAAPPPPVQPARIPFDLGRYKLVGVAQSEDYRGILVADARTSRTVRLRVGETLDGWTLRRVESREAALERGEETVRLTLPGAKRLP